MSYTVNHTMMRTTHTWNQILQSHSLSNGGTILMIIKRWRPSWLRILWKEGNRLYVIAQFYPRMAVYNDVEGWQNMQFWKWRILLCLRRFWRNITVPADHVMEATGELIEAKFYAGTSERYELAQKSLISPVVTSGWGGSQWKGFLKEKTWKFSAKTLEIFELPHRENSFMMQWQFKGDVVMAASVYPKEANPLWGETSTITVAHTLKATLHTHYPYPKRYPYRQRIREWNILWFVEWSSRYEWPVKLKMGVVIHEVGHNFSQWL
jgi:hypothetical protein